MKSLNRVTLLGNLGRDAETKFTQSGVAKTTFSIATTRRVKDGDQWKDETDWHNVIAWRNEGAAPYLTKGKQVYVEGRLQTRSYEKDGERRYVTEVVAEELILLGGDKSARPSGGGRLDDDRPAPKAGGQSGASAPAGAPWPSELTDDDAPF